MGSVRRYYSVSGLLLVAAAMNAGSPAIVTVSGQTITPAPVADPGNAKATVIFNADGTVDQNRNESVTQIDSATDWIIPNEKASGDYDVRYTGLTGDALDIAAAAEDAWIALSSDREFGLTQTVIGTKDTTVTIEIRGPDGSTIDSASYRFITEVTA